MSVESLYEKICQCRGMKKGMRWRKFLYIENVFVSETSMFESMYRNEV